jgi:L-malate glycosyltransferase
VADFAGAVDEERKPAAGPDREVGKPMEATDEFVTKGRSVLLVSPKVPPYGGIAIQAGLMETNMNAEGIRAGFLASNIAFPPALAWMEKVRGFRPFFRSAVMCWHLSRMAPEYDVIHVMACSWLYFFVVVIPALIISRLRGGRVVLNYRGGEADKFFGRSAWVLRPFFRVPHVVTAPSGFLVQVIGRRIGVPVQIVPNIVNVERFPFRERERMRPRMIVTRHLLKLYDCESVLRAFRQVQEIHPDASLKIVGTGDQELFLRGLVDEWKLRNVEFLGYVPQADLPKLYDECDILMNGSHADNFPGSLVEAGASGLAVVSTNAGGIPYIFENGRSAVLVNPGDWKGLADGVLRVLSDAAFAERLRHEAARDCRQYEWKQVRCKLYEIYGFEKTRVMKPSETLVAVLGGR